MKPTAVCRCGWSNTAKNSSLSERQALHVRAMAHHEGAKENDREHMRAHPIDFEAHYKGKAATAATATIAPQAEPEQNPPADTTPEPETAPEPQEAPREAISGGRTCTRCKEPSGDRAYCPPCNAKNQEYSRRAKEKKEREAGSGISG